jgi:uncharacterized coiled-coil DUF342 family protein
VTARAALPPTDVDALRDEVARLNAHIAKYTVNEPTIAEELAYRSSEIDRLRDERDQARRWAVALEQELAHVQAGGTL